MPFVLILSRDVVCTLLSCSAVDVVRLFFVAGHRIGLLTVPHACGGSRNVLNFFLTCTVPRRDNFQDYVHAW